MFDSAFYDPLLCFLGAKEDVTALDIRSHISESCFIKYSGKRCHGDDVFAADVDAANECDHGIHTGVGRRVNRYRAISSIRVKGIGFVRGN